MNNFFNNLNILLVEDELDIREAIKDTLSFSFKNVYTASDGLEALNILKEKEIHTILTDYEMPNMNGLEFIKNVRENDKKIPIAVISNHNEKEILHNCIPLFLSAYLFKPITYSKIKDYLNDLSSYYLENNLLIYNFSKDFKFDIVNRILYEKEVCHQLTKFESDFLECFVSLEGQVATFEYMFDKLHLYNPNYSSIKNVVYRIKSKYNFSYIKSIKDVGYIIINDEK